MRIASEKLEPEAVMGGNIKQGCPVCRLAFVFSGLPFFLGAMVQTYNHPGKRPK